LTGFDVETLRQRTLRWRSGGFPERADRSGSIFASPLMRSPNISVGFARKHPPIRLAVPHQTMTSSKAR